MSKTFKAQSGPTQISDLVRQMDVGLSKYRKLIDTLPQHCDKTGLDLQQVDLTLMLLRSLPSDVKNYVVLHASGEGYTDYRSAALKFEQQQRLFQELGGGSGRNMHALEAEGDWSTYYGYEDEQDYYAEGAEEEWEWDPESELWLNTAAINKNSGVKCRKCGKTGHMQKDCSTNMGSCEVLQVRTERAYWRELPSQQSEVCKFFSVFEHWERFRCSQGQACSESWTRKRWSQGKDA